MTNLTLALIMMTVVAYLFGSVSSAVIVCKIMGLPDPRAEGSRNPGATNVLRIGGKKAAIITIVGDILKGVIPVLLAKWFELPAIGIALAFFAAFIGHLYPIFFGFIGGKGIATFIGGLMVLSWQSGLGFLIIWLFIIVITRYVSLASICATIVTPIFLWWFTHEWIYVLTAVVIALIVIYRHRNNIRKLYDGTERKLGKK